MERAGVHADREGELGLPGRRRTGGPGPARDERRRGGVSTDAVATAEILSYSRSKGLFAGIDLSGGVLRPDEDANKDVYGAGAMPSRILATREMSAPPEAAPFLSALKGTAAPSVPRPMA